MHVLALNPGSATLKYRLYDLPQGGAERQLAGGTLDHVGEGQMPAAVEEALGRCLPLGVDAVGCRVVHGGERFRGPTRITDEALAALDELSRLAPLHNPLAVTAIQVCRRRLPEAPTVAVFDTSFHQTIPEVASLYALPLDWARQRGLRRYGFHGLSHRFVSERLLSLLGRPAAGSRLVVCHLGNGASVCAVRDGRSVDTSMGLTPLEGLIMGTRCGDIDPGLLLYLLRDEGMSPDRLGRLLEHESGLLGLGGKSDVRDLEKAATAGDARARLALEAFAYRARKYIGAYTAALGGLDGLAFTAGIGEHSAHVRGLICRGLECLGVRLDEARNQGVKGEGPIGTDGSPVGVWVVPTDEERQIAREAAEVARG
jgi:acetate kinase